MNKYFVFILDFFHKKLQFNKIAGPVLRAGFSDAFENYTQPHRSV